MKPRTLAATLAALTLAGCATTGTEMAGGSKEMKLAFDFTDGNPVVLLNKLNNVDVTRKQLIESGVTPKIVMTLSASARSASFTAAKLREMKKAPGVQGLEQCNLPLADRKLKPADL